MVGADDVRTKVTFQADWGQEFGGDNLSRITRLSTRYLHPLEGDLRRYPLGRKGYNGRIERSHRTDSEEFYRPYLLHAKDTDQLLALAPHWVYFYNTIRPRFGKAMCQRPPLEVLRRLGYNGRATIAALPPVLLDQMSTDLRLASRIGGGHDLLATYHQPKPGHVYVIVHLRVKNLGPRASRSIGPLDFQDMDAKAAVRGDTYLSAASDCRLRSVDPTVGGSIEACIGFEVPDQGRVDLIYAPFRYEDLEPGRYLSFNLRP